MTLKDQYQYRRYNKKAEGEKDKNCRHCKNRFGDYYCHILSMFVMKNFLCDRFGRG
jgi:hypothetical protein